MTFKVDNTFDTDIKKAILEYTGGDLDILKYPVSINSYLWLFYRKVIQNKLGVEATQELTQNELEQKYLEVSNYGAEFRHIVPMSYLHHDMKIDTVEQDIYE